jgi:hypothetical protein
VLGALRHNLGDTGDMRNARFVTTGDIARELDCPLHRVTYAVQRFRIREDMRVGVCRLFRRERLPQIAALIGQITGKDRCPAD